MQRCLRCHQHVRPQLAALIKLRARPDLLLSFGAPCEASRENFGLADAGLLQDGTFTGSCSYWSNLFFLQAAIQTLIAKFVAQFHVVVTKVAR